MPPGRRADRLEARVLGADALQHRVRTDPVGQVQHPRDALVTALGDDVGGAELGGDLLA
jgi:hypothetical protein